MRLKQPSHNDPLDWIVIAVIGIVFIYKLIVGLSEPSSPDDISWCSDAHGKYEC